MTHVSNRHIKRQQSTLIQLEQTITTELLGRCGQTDKFIIEERRTSPAGAADEPITAGFVFGWPKASFGVKRAPSEPNGLVSSS